MTTPQSPAADTRRPQVIVAVHGIGEQIEFETAQSVVYEISRLHGFPRSIPLGQFRVRPTVRRRPRVESTSTQGFEPLGVQLLSSSEDKLWFAEVYWAGIPRKLVENKFVLEESKKWAKTIAAQLALEDTATKATTPRARKRRLSLLEIVVEELVETVFVLERLFSLFAHLGLFRFQLKELLTSFVGDVQVVAEFREERQQILTAFSEVMTKIHDHDKIKNPDIYIVAHSEGTVVALLGLLAAINEVDPEGAHPADSGHWIYNVRGLMTLGSPLEPHYRFWRPMKDGSLWPERKVKGSALTRRIQWRNYFDYSDPIAYSLTSVGPWVAEHFGDWIDFSLSDHEHAFSRYWFPGKAHIDYWRDDRVFGHFVHTVMNGVMAAGPNSLAPQERPPRGYGVVWAFSYTMPYLLVLALIAAGVYALYHPVIDILRPDAPAVDPKTWSGSQVAFDVAGISLMLAGMSACTVIIRLTTSWRGFVAGLAAFAACVVPLTQVAPAAKAIAFIDRMAFPAFPAVAAAWLPDSLAWSPLLLTAAAIALVAGTFSRFVPRARLHMLGALGAAATLMIVLRVLGVWGVTDAERRVLAIKDAWPVAVGGLLFMYLWWLASMLFELTFVWHRYVRQEAMFATGKK